MKYNSLEKYEEEEILLFNNYYELFTTNTNDINTMRYEDLVKLKDPINLKGFYLFDKVKIYSRIFFGLLGGKITELRTGLSEIKRNIQKYKLSRYKKFPETYGYIDIFKNKNDKTKINFKYKEQGGPTQVTKITRLPGVICGQRASGGECTIITNFDLEPPVKKIVVCGKISKFNLCFIMEMVFRKHGLFYRFEEMSYLN